MIKLGKPGEDSDHQPAVRPMRLPPFKSPIIRLVIGSKYLKVLKHRRGNGVWNGAADAIVKIDRAQAIAARARIRRRHISSDVVAEIDSRQTMSAERSRDVRGRFVKGHAGGPGRPPRDCLREAFTNDLFSIWRRHGKQVLRQLRQENPGSYLRLVAGLVESERRKSGSNGTRHRSITARRAGPPISMQGG
jgi:hypothetical protein